MTDDIILIPFRRSTMQPVDERWLCVPMECTPAMHLALVGPNFVNGWDVWRAMLAAAPKPTIKGVELPEREKVDAAIESEK